jgi:hypothetical protein
MKSIFGKKKPAKGWNEDIFDISGNVAEIECTLSTYSRTDACEALFLNRYTADDMKDLMRSTGLAWHCASKGHDSLIIDVERDDNKVHYFRVYSGKFGAENLLMDLRLSEKTFEPESPLLRKFVKRLPLDILYLEWISLQNPGAKFTTERPRLPGQDRPGLGAAKYLFLMLEKLGTDLQKDGLMDVPERIHSAVMYSKRFLFMDPEMEGTLRAIMINLGNRPLNDLALAMEHSAILDCATGKPFKYSPTEQIMPLSKELKNYFKSDAYCKAVEGALGRIKFSLDEQGLKKDMKK